MRLNAPARRIEVENGRAVGVTYRDAKGEERRVLKVARVPLPAFDEAARAGDIFKEEAEAAILGLKTPEDAMASLARRVKPMLPA